VSRGGCRDGRGPVVFDWLKLRGILDAEADVDAIHPLDGTVHCGIVGERPWHVLELAAELLARSRGVAYEQAYVMALCVQRSGDRRADQPGPADDEDPLDPHGIPLRGPNRRSMCPPIT
jgi:hypothetical protein